MVGTSLSKLQSLWRTASSSSLASSTGNPPELRIETSLIDFDADLEPPSTALGPQIQQTVPAPVVAQPTKSSNNNWASFDSSLVIKPTQPPPPSSNLLDVLSELSVPASGNNAAVTSVQIPPTPIAPPSTFNAFGDYGYGGQWQAVLSHQNLVPATGIQPATSSFNQFGDDYLKKSGWVVVVNGNISRLTLVTGQVESQLTGKRFLRRKSNDFTRLIVTITIDIFFGFFIGSSFPAFSSSKALGHGALHLEGGKRQQRLVSERLSTLHPLLCIFHLYIRNKV